MVHKMKQFWAQSQPSWNEKVKMLKTDFCFTNSASFLTHTGDATKDTVGKVQVYSTYWMSQVIN